MKIFEIDNLKHYLTTSAGVAMAQAISFISVPFIAKICGTEVFGHYNYILSIIAIFSVFASMRLEYTVFTIKESLYELLNSIFSKITLFLSITLAFGVLFFIEIKSEQFGIAIIAFFLTLFSVANFEFSVQKNIKLGQFKLNALIRIIRSFLFPILFYVLYLISEINEYMVLIAFALSNLLPIFIIKNHKQIENNKHTFSFNNIYNLILASKRIIFYLIPAHLLSRYSTGIFLLVVGNFFANNESLAFYSLAAKFVIAPALIIVSAVSDVIKREVLLSPKRALNNYYKISLFSGAGCAVFILCLIFIAKPLIGLTMGNEWLPTYQYAISLTPYLFTLVVFGPITFIYVILNKQKYDFYWQFFNAIFISCALIFGLQYSLLIGVWAFSIASSISITISALLCIYFANQSTVSKVN